MAELARGLFLDRDGVINVDSGHPIHKEQIVFLEGIVSIVRKANDLNYKVVIVTNQSGIGRGYFTSEQFWDLMQWMREYFASKGSRIDGIYHCPHSPEFIDPSSGGVCVCRKPSTGMIFSAAADLGISLDGSILIGDKESDIMAAKNAGIRRRILIGTVSVRECTDMFASVAELEAEIDEILE